jgi:hypothetical protein
MDLDSVRELKQRVLAGTAAPLPAEALEAYRPVPARGLVGVAPAAGGGYLLAVRLTSDDAALRPWVATLVDRAREEVDVRVVGPIGALSQPPDLRRRVRPLHRGLSIAHRDVTAGTLGAFVARRDDPRPLVLSNSHVLAMAGTGSVGDPVYQPGPADGGGEDDRVGSLLSDVPFAEDAPNLVDAALAALDEGVEVDLSAGDGPLAGIWAGNATDLLDGVQKVGRTTGVTTGRVTAFEVDAVPVGFGEDRVLTFDDQLEIEGIDGPFSAGGDSGSVICSLRTRLAAALLFAGSTTGGPGGTGLTYANPLPTVLELLDVELRY